MHDLVHYLSEHDPNFRKARLPALYADFQSQRTLNPDGYRANVIAWQDGLSCLAYQGLLSTAEPRSSALILSVDASLLRALQSKQYGQPLALSSAIRDAISSRKFIPVDSFLTSPQTTHPPTLASLTWKAAEWAFGILRSTNRDGGQDILPAGRYVLTGNLDAVCQVFQTQAAGRVTRFDRVFTKLHFRTSFANQLVSASLLSEEDVEVLLVSLSRDRRLIDYDGAVVRIRDSSDESTITQEDAAAASIKELIANIKHQTDILNNRLAQLQNEAKAAMQSNNRIAARAALKSKKLAETSLSQRYSTLNQLEDIAARIEQASDQVQLVKILNSSANALKSLNSRVGGSARVEEVMDQIREQMCETDEVAAILSETTSEHIDESELEEELAALKEGAPQHDAYHEDGIPQEAPAKAQKTHSDSIEFPEPPSEEPSSHAELTPSDVERQVAQLSLKPSQGEI
ncbi:hypothetical protein E4U42_007759 [Claviceps africana]|uniref:Uncharacterized protein n=1 Tax=Claviceps africana TaxID=83212 RepID=A0A8K0JB71_9HYPO|nr:hypothetical protein E4U42_007759 [Claviceps africana]